MNTLRDTYMRRTHTVPYVHSMRILMRFFPLKMPKMFSHKAMNHIEYGEKRKDIDRKKEQTRSQKLTREN